MTIYEHLIAVAVRAIESVAITMIVAAACIAAWELVLALLRSSMDTAATNIRLRFGQHLVLALEFLIAADILKTVLTPTLQDLGFLGGIILIRTILSVSIAYELRRAAQDNVDHPNSKSSQS